MKKLIACAVVVLGGVVAARTWPGLMPWAVADEPREVTESGANADSPVPGKDLETEDALSNDADPLAWAASQCEIFRWSIEIEDRLAGAAYAPDVERDFRSRYDLDVPNQSQQTWDNYSYWVRIVYSGNLIARGWDYTSEKVLARDNRPETARYLSVLGRVIGAEWSKSNDVRLINNSDIMRWGNEIKNGTTTLPELTRIIGERLAK